MNKRRRKNALPPLLVLIPLTAAFGCTAFAVPPLPLRTAAEFCGGMLCAPHAAAAAARQVLDETVSVSLSPDDAVPAAAAAENAAKPSVMPQQTAAPENAAEFSHVPASAPAPAPFVPFASAPPSPLMQQRIPEGMAPLYQRFFPLPQGAGYVPSGASVVRNCTDLADSSLVCEMMQPLPFTVTPDSEEPQVLIVHTHTTECYEDTERCWCDPDFSARTTDCSKNVVAVGNAVCQELEARGIKTLHDTTLHDYPSYTGSYAKSRATVQSYLQRYPSIRIILDVHRDAIGAKDGSRTKPAVELNGQKCAQVMLICGADQGGNLPNCRQNLRFASRFQDQMERMFPGLARPVLFDYRFYNQDLSTGSLLLEVGGHANTLQEAVYAGSLAGKALAALVLDG